MSIRPLLLGHRGVRTIKSIPENTLAAFDRALTDGCDGFEFDVRLAVDGEAVVCHDSKAGALEIAQATRQQLSDLPRLQDVLERYQRSAFLDIELKVPGLEKATVKLLEQHKPQRGFVVSSFLPEVLRVLHAEDPTIPLGLICETKAQLDRWRELTAEYLIAHDTLVGKDLLREIKSEGRKLLVWTVNTSAAMQRFAKWGVDGIISDDHALLSRTLSA